MFLLLICLTALTLPLAGEALTTEYWVRPDTVLECPQETPQHQCVTITDLVLYSTNGSLTKGSNLTINFLPGVHTPRVEGRILIANENWNSINLTASITGKRSGGSGAVIWCSLTSTNIALVFNQISHLVIRDIKITNCGNRTGVHLSGDYSEFFGIRLEFVSNLNERIASIAIINEASTQNSVLMDHVIVDSSLGFGVLILQHCSYTYGTKCMTSLLTVHLIDSIIQYSNIHQPRGLFGGNLLFLARSELCVITNNLTISYSYMGQNNQRYTSFFKNGGVEIYPDDGYVTMRFQNSKFVGNEAIEGGGLRIKHGNNGLNPLKNYSSYGMVEISNCTFISNNAVIGGGIIIQTSQIISLYVKIKFTLFSKNTAKRRGGAMYLAFAPDDWNRVLIYGCVFVQNAADRGAAIFPVLYNVKESPHNCSPAVSQSIFTENTVYYMTNFESKSVIELYNSALLCLDSVNITDNNCRGLLVKDSTLIINRTVVISNNYAVRGSGGGILTRCQHLFGTQLVFNKESLLIMQNNRADERGGGICFSQCYTTNGNGCQVIALNVTQPLVVMANNTAQDAGNSVYGTNLSNYCTYKAFWRIFSIAERNSSQAMLSTPLEACICSSDYFTKKHNCSSTVNRTIFRGQALNGSVMCVGQFGYTDPCVFRTETITGAEFAVISKLENETTHCTNFSYVIRTQSVEQRSALLTLHSSAYHFIQINIQNYCPLGFKTALNNYNLVCICSDHLHEEGLVCNIDEVALYKTATMWVGNYSGDIAVNRNCPFGYCKTNFTAVNVFNQQDQCNFNRRGVLCGACRPGLSLVLGTSQCKQCSNLYLLLLIPFSLAGVVLVLLLLKCNLTVSTGTINGLIFYANIVQASKTAFFPTGSNSIFIHILSVFIAWLNLDLGIETCYAEGLNTYYRTWLQFVFPVYIWSLVGVMIVVSRYSIRVSRWTGSNTVSVLATLFLLSYAKLLRVTFDAFASTSLTDANGTTTLLWLLDGDYIFLQWPHSLLFTAALVTLLGHIVPFTALLLVSPTLQRYSHHKPLRWVNRMKPLLDAYQGPYRTKVRYWTGLLYCLFV